MKKIIIILLCVCICACGMSKTWDIKSMNVSKKLQPPTNISMNLIRQKNNVLTIEFKNNGNKTWTYGEGYLIQVLINDEWYDVPTEMVFIKVGYNLYPNETVTKTYDLTFYNSLPTGVYRIVVSDLDAQFIIE